MVAYTMPQQRKKESPMIPSSCKMPFSSVSLHINLRSLILRFTNMTSSYFFFRSTTVDLHLSTFLAPFSFTLVTKPEVNSGYDLLLIDYDTCA